MRLALLWTLAATTALAQQQPQDGPTLGFVGRAISAWEAAAAGVPYGVLVDEAIYGSPAEAAGLKRDDIIIELGGAPLHGLVELEVKVAQAGIGGEIKVTVLRGKEKLPLAWKSQAGSEAARMIGLKAPQLRVDGWVGGDAVSLAKLSGKPVAIVLWSLVMPAEMKPNAADTEAMFLAWQQAWSGKGLTVVPIHVLFRDFAAHPAEDGVHYVEGKKFPMPAAHATGEPFQMPGRGPVSPPLVLSDYRVQTLPSVILLDKDGKIAARWEGQEVGDGEAAKKKIEEMLGGK